MTWWQALIDAGAIPGNGGKGEEPEPSAAEPADIVEGRELETFAVDRAAARVPAVVSFLNGIERWSVVAYDGVVQVVNAYVAAAVRRRDERRVLSTILERSRTFAVAPLDRMSPAPRQALQQSATDIEAVDGDLVEQPARYREMVEATVRRVRAHLERELAEAALDDLGADQWLVVDGLLSRSPAVARHPRTLGVIKSHGAQFLEGRGLERALTLPAGYRTGVFAVRGGHTRTEVYSWYLRLWPWEGNDLLYGLLRVEARADAETVKHAFAVSGWLWAERAPLATPATRWDRLLYPLHHVEEYLKARAPRDVQLRRASRLPRTGT
ncbi:MAG TPA: hypothetical protein VGQ29_02385 [Gemmatimonadales bacterium]|nr:hypothetical protein [Gemmatimonadales bacterium]